MLNRNFAVRSFVRLAPILLLAVAIEAGHAQPTAGTQPTVRAASPTNAEVRRAIDQLRKDPALRNQHTERMLHWRSDSKEADKSSGSIKWLQSLLPTIAGLTRVLLWIGMGLLAAALMAGLIRLFRDASLPRIPKSLAVPSHVSHLDIRPESLPADVGAAAQALWDRGQSRAALSLLYRGLLSRLVHVHGVPIRESSTEGECVQLAASRLDTGPLTYVSNLVRVWQAATYGAQRPQATDIHDLCAGFPSAVSARSTMSARI